MVSEFLDPNSNINTIWNTFDFSNINDGTRNPSVPGLDLVLANTNDDFEKQEWGMTNPTLDFSEITSIDVNIYFDNYGSSNFIQCNIKVGGIEETSQDIVSTGGAGWRVNTFNGSWTKSEVDSLEISIQPQQIGKIGEVEILGFYAEITGTISELNGTTRQIKIGGSFVEKPILTKVGGTFVDKPIKIKVGGTFQDA